MTTFNDLVDIIKAGARPRVRFTKKIEELETYPEAGMSAQIIGAAVVRDPGVIKIVMDYTDYDATNMTMEAHNYYDRNGTPCLTAREAGMYTAQEDIYFMSTDMTAEYFEIIDGNGLIDSYQASGSKGTYVEWLEDKVNELRVELTRHRTLSPGTAETNPILF